MNRKRSKIGRRITLVVFISVILSIFTLTAIFLYAQLQDTIKARTSATEATGYVFASAVAEHVAARSRPDTLNTLRSIARVPDITFVTALDAGGHQIASFGKTAILQDDLVAPTDSLLSLLTSGQLPVAVEIVKGSKPVGRLILIADVTNVRTQLGKALVWTALAALIAGLIGIAVASRLQRRITGPITSLTQAMSHIREVRDYTTKVDHQADDETGELVETFNAMISEIGYRDAALERLAYFDPLTGAANRQDFHRELDAVLSSGNPAGIHAALFLLDLDEFKSINDSYGHSAGDALLVNVAACLKQECSSNMHLARLGGDEFAIVASDIASENHAQEALAPLVARLSQPVEIMGRQVLIGTSVGVAMIPRDGASSGDLLRRADLALYSAKRDGRGRVHFYRPKLDEDAQTRTAIAHDLRRAIAEGQLDAHYQPLVSTHTGAVAGFESLLRWRHPVRGMVSPGVFIPIAESNGLINDLGQWMLRESCRQAKRWLDDGWDGQISVNVSVAQIRGLDFEHEVEAILRETNLPASKLCLELTESLFAGGSPQKLKRVLEALKAIGVCLAIDDFGTGYSSLSYLRGFPFDKLKIDRAFVHGIETDADQRRLLKGIVELAHALDLRTVAEGAETSGEVALLTDMRVDEIQGYYFSRPVAASEAMKTVQNLNCSERALAQQSGKTVVLSSPALRIA